MNWKKEGQIFKVNSSNPDLISHASNPLAIHLKEDIYRIFFSARNIENKSSISFVDIDILKKKIIKISGKTIIKYGIDESFYSHGISIGNLFRDKKNKQFILFMGWQIREGNHWRGDIGKLELISNNSLKLTQKTPFMSSDSEDKVSLSYPFVIFHDDIYKMWYGSTINWTSENKEMIHVIKYATSKDGNIWEKHGIAIPYEIGVAQAFSKPSVIIDENGFHMWYSFRGGNGLKYRIGYAFSKNGIEWQRKHNLTGIDVSDKGWDSEMICYPFVFEHKENLYMLYNGNSYGKDGFGLALLIK
ncbi:hypothetical protein [uncultured Polaribacter sp.]|uniref:hypothetical protein n=1 Tax=uncultured Polaribacter sp. TaxID=174711 RepID=UPI002611D7C9|nr:hypothetical protein [uncultured Polaribacter sp.]